MVAEGARDSVGPGFASKHCVNAFLKHDDKRYSLPSVTPDALRLVRSAGKRHASPRI
jgi:hypothetical protein